MSREAVWRAKLPVFGSTRKEPAITTLFRRTALLSIGFSALSLGGPVSAEAVDSPFWGRWKVDRDADAPTPSSRGREYMTIDIAPCGKDFCGVSVKGNGQCGPVLFRFLMKHAGGTRRNAPYGNGKWGSGRKTIIIWVFNGGANADDRNLQVFLGDGHDFGGRSANMPKFEATYSHSGVAMCKTR